MQQFETYCPVTPVSGPAYSPWFKLLATVLSFGITGYVISFLLRYRIDAPSVLLLAAAIVVLMMSYSSFLRATVTIDAQ